VHEFSASVQTELLDRPQSTSLETANDAADATSSPQPDVLQCIQQCLQADESLQVMVLDSFSPDKFVVSIVNKKSESDYRPRSRKDNTFGSVHVCVCVCVSVRLSLGALLFEGFDL